MFGEGKKKLFTEDCVSHIMDDKESRRERRGDVNKNKKTKSKYILVNTNTFDNAWIYQATYVIHGHRKFCVHFQCDTEIHCRKIYI